MKKETIVANTMREFKEGKLRSSSGDKVTDRDQAIAIALSKSGQSKYAKGGYVVQYDPEKKKTITRTKKEADDFVEVLKKNGHTLIEIFKVGEESKSKAPAPKSDANDIDDALTGAKTLLKFASASEKKEIETFIKGLEILKKMSGEPKTSKPEKMKTMSLSKDRDYVKEAKEYFIDAGFIDELNTDERFYVEELIKGLNTKNRSKTEIEANEYFIENEMADQLTKDKQFYVVKLIENSKKKPAPKIESKKSASKLQPDPVKKSPEKKSESLESIKKQIIDFVEKNSWFELDDDSDDFMLFATRENGNVGSESPGSKDIAEAKRLKQEIEKKFKGLVKIELEAVDEWVHINIDIKESNSSPESSKTVSNKEIDYKKVLADKLSVSEEKAEKIISFFRYSKEYYEKYKNTDPKKYNNSFRVYADNYIKYKDSSKINHEFNSAKEVFDYIQSSDFKESFYRNANPINKVQVGLYGWDSLTLKLNKDGFPYDSNEETDYRADRTITLSAYPFAMVNIYDSKDFTKKLEKIISDFISSYKIYVLNENKFESGGSISKNYEIVEGYDHYKNIPLYRVTDRDEYVGEWHSNRSDAEKELSGFGTKFNDGGSVKSNTRLGEKYIYTPYIDSVYTITDKLKFGQKWILTNDKNPYETHRLNNFEIDQWIKSGILKPIDSKYEKGGDVRGMDWYQMWQPKRNKVVKVGDIVVHQHSKQPYKIIELLDDQYTVAKLDGNKEIEWKTFYEDFENHKMFMPQQFAGGGTTLNQYIWNNHDLMIKGRYKVTGAVEAEVVIAGWEVGGDSGKDEYLSMYQPSLEQNQEIKTLNVKRAYLRKMSNGLEVPATTGTGKKVKIQRIGGIYF